MSANPVQPNAAATLTLADAYALAVRYYESGDLPAAQQVTERILAVRPDLSEARHLDGLIQLRAGRPAAAVACFEAALRGRRTANTLNALASVLQQCGRLGEAVEAQQEAIALEPDAALWRFNLGVLLQSAGRDDEAAAAYLAAGRLGSSDGFNAVGRRRYELGDADGAMRAFEATCALDPARPEAMTGLGLCRTAFGRRTEALRLHERALAVDPLRLDDLVHGCDQTRCRLLFGVQTDWVARTSAILPLAAERAEWRLLSSLLYRDLYRPLTDAARDAAACVLDRRLRALAGNPAAPVLQRASRSAAGRRLRIGYLSAHLHNHPIGQVTLSLFAAHDRDRVETHGFFRKAFNPQDPYAVRHRAGFEHIHELAGVADPAEAARRVAGAELDALIYLDGHMDKGGLEIMARRPAPVRVFWLGHAGGLGSVCADYLLTDHVVTPEDDDRLYGEKLVRLADCYHCADRHPIAERPRRADHGLPDDAVVFCAFNNLEKIDEAVFAAWMELLRSIPAAVLWLSDAGGSDAADNLRASAAAAGVEPRRLVFAGRVPDKRDHLARYQLADVFLDTWTMNASSTALDALWAGVPIVARSGDRFSNRISNSMLKAVDMGDYVTPSTQAYLALAAALALNPEMRLRQRERLRRNLETTPLFDIDRFARKLERAYARMCAHAETGALPQSFEAP